MKFNLADVLHWRASFCGDWKVFLLIYSVRGLMILTLILFFMAAWRFFGPVKADVDGWRRPAAQVCAKAIQEELRAHRGENRTMTCLPFEGDSSDAIFNAVRTELLSSGAFDVRGLSFASRVRNGLNLSLEPVVSDAEAARRARRSKSDVALCGAVKFFERTDRGVNMTVEYRLIDAASGSVIFQGVYDRKPVAPEVEAAEVEASSTPDGTVKAALWGNWERVLTLLDQTRSRFQSFMLWTLLALSLPILTFRFLEGATAQKSNAVNFFTLLLYLSIDAVCARLVIAPNLDSHVTQAAVVVMAFFAFWYNARIMAVANRRSEPTAEIRS